MERASYPFVAAINVVNSTTSSTRLKIIVERGIGRLDELRQRCRCEVAIVVVHRRDPRADTRATSDLIAFRPKPALPTTQRHCNDAAATSTGALRMTRLYSRTSAASLVACLLGCSNSAPPASPVAMPALPRVTSVNGTYNGLMQLTSGSPDSCGTSNIFTLVVQNKGFRYVLNQPQVPWQPQRVFAATIAPDGSFNAGTGVAYMRGTASQGHMQGQIVGDACQFQFEADSDGTF
ncbi:MAG TPA: hypothetical protein VL614_01755 [Acetobacteraceae bacterium]|nr:hypothetical protein [Acetobacteraceae bacterium]